MTSYGSWSSTSIGVTVPSGTTTGDVVVTVSGVPSNGKNFTVTESISSTIFYYFGDHLGNSRVITTSTGTVCYDADLHPFGGERAYTNNCSQNYMFTGKERDSESGLDNFGARYYSSQYGRFMSPDPGVPSLTNPQTLNKYSYVANNPLAFVDPNGKFMTHYHITWGINALGQMGLGDQESFVTGANNYIDSFAGGHGFDNPIHAMAGPGAFVLARSFLLDKASSPSFPGNGSASMVALVMGMHLVQDAIAHKGITSMWDHLGEYKLGDDENPQDMNAAKDATQAFLMNFKTLLIAHLGDQGAQDALLSMSAASDISSSVLKRYVDDFSATIDGIAQNYNDWRTGFGAFSRGEPTGISQGNFSEIENLNNYGDCLYNGHCK